MKSLKLWHLLSIALLFNSCDACKNNGVRKVEAAAFEAELEASNAQLFPNQSTAITLTILSNDPKAASLEYSLEKIGLTSGKLFLEGINEELTVGTKLDFGTQNLIFKPSKERGEATINLTVVSSEGYASEAKINIKVVEVRLEMQAELANISAYHPIPVSLKLSSSYQEAQDLTYTIKEIESTKGTLALEDSGKEAKPGDLLTYGVQGLIFKPTGELGEAAIKLTLVSNQGHEVSTKFTLQLRPTSFQLSVVSPFKNAFINQASKIALDIFSDEKEAEKLSYTVKEIESTKGTLVFEHSGEELKAGSALTYGAQNLVFKPSGETGEAVIKLTVVNDGGEERSATLNLNVKNTGFSFKIASDEQSIFAHQQLEMMFEIESNYPNWSINSLTYTIKEVEIPFGSLKFYLDSREVLPGDRAKLDYHARRLIFDPCGQTGTAVIKLTVISNEGEEKTSSVVVQVKTVGFDFKIKSDKAYLFSHQNAIISLSSQLVVRRAPKLTYTVKEAQVAFGSLTFKHTGKAVVAGDALELDRYGESLTFDPMGQTGEAVIRLTVVSNEGEERSASLTINVVPVDFDVEGLAGIDIYDEMWPNPEYNSIIELQVINKKYDGQNLYSGPWHVVGWSFSDGVKRKIMYPSVFYYKDKLKILNKEEDEKDLVEFPIPINSDGKIKFWIDMGAVKIDKIPRIRFLIEGAQGTIREVEVSLEKAQGMALAKKIGAYKEVAERVSKQIGEFLPGGWRCSSYTSSSEGAQRTRQLSQEAGEILSQFEQVRKELSEIDQWWKGPTFRSLLSLNNAYGVWAIDDLNTLIKDTLPKLFKGKAQLDYLYGIK